ncbi:MAG: futalosine hydrolase [Saprospiraceae bacterium]|nr:futalosine hydrolase [Candidatus Defluviibacterium haderslevense]MBK7243932.1 futalosine hydrolase [Candidatus Defluviibacterium haderslevense]
MKILLVSATVFELMPTLEYLEKHFETKSFSEFTNGIHSIHPFVTGVGSPMMAFGMGKLHDAPTYDLVIHGGLSGAYDNQFNLGDVVEVVKERWADLGAEEQDGAFTDLVEMELMDGNRIPFSEGWILNKQTKYTTGLDQCTGLTVNKVSGTQKSIDAIKNKYSADVESMEGATLFYACRMWDIPFISIRGISNYVQPRDKSSWKIPEAIEKMNERIIGMIGRL